MVTRSAPGATQEGRLHMNDPELPIGSATHHPPVPPRLLLCRECGAERSFVRATAGKEGPQARDDIAWRVLEAGGTLTDASVSLSEAQPTLLG